MALILKGAEIELGGRKFTVPPLNLNALERLGPKFTELTRAMDSNDFGQMFTSENVNNLTEIIHASLVRNYPELTANDVKDLVDLGNLKEAFEAVCAQSNLKKVAAGEVKGPKSR
jgi:hypothetical protein